MAKYLDSDGVLYLWNKIKSTFVKKESGKGLSTNDFTTALMNKLNGIASGANNYVHPSYTSRASGLYKIVVDATGHISQVAAVTKTDITALGIPAQDTTYSNMTGATASAAGKAGLVPAPTAGKQTSFLRGDGTWVIPPNTTYGVVTGNSNGLATPEMYNKVNSGLVAKASFSGLVLQLKAQNDAVLSSVEIPTTDVIDIENTYPVTSKAVDNILGNFVQTKEITEIESKAQNALNIANSAQADVDNIAQSLVGVYIYKGSVTNSSNLPTSGQTKGDVYNIVNASSYGAPGTNVAWDGSKWDALGGLFEIESITNTEIDAICV